MTLRRITLPGQVKNKSGTNNISLSMDLLSYAADDIKGIYDYLYAMPGIYNTPSFGTINPNKKGLIGNFIIADKDSKSGLLFNSTEGRPKTISECLNYFAEYISSITDSKDIESQLILIKNRIGSQLFSVSTMHNDSTSLDGRINLLQKQLRQLSADIFNSGELIGSSADDSIYNLSGANGTQTRSVSIVDSLSTVINAHGGIGKNNHEHLFKTHTFASVINQDQFIDFGKITYFSPFSGLKSDSKISFFALLENSSAIKRFMVRVATNSLNANSSVSLNINGVEKHRFNIAPKIQSSIFDIQLDFPINDMDEIYFCVDTKNSTYGGIHITNITTLINERIEG